MANDAYRTQRVTLEITVDTRRVMLPAHWNWSDLVACDGIKDTMTVVRIEDVPTNGEHVTYLQEDDAPAQDREAYTDTQDRDNYSSEEE